MGEVCVLLLVLLMLLMMLLALCTSVAAITGSAGLLLSSDIGGATIPSGEMLGGSCIASSGAIVLSIVDSTGC
jgi:hypothetical protein